MYSNNFNFRPREKYSIEKERERERERLAERAFDSIIPPLFIFSPISRGRKKAAGLARARTSSLSRGRRQWPRRDMVRGQKLSSFLVCTLETANHADCPDCIPDPFARRGLRAIIILALMAASYVSVLLAVHRPCPTHYRYSG